MMFQSIYHRFIYDDVVVVLVFIDVERKDHGSVMSSMNDCCCWFCCCLYSPSPAPCDCGFLSPSASDWRLLRMPVSAFLVGSEKGFTFFQFSLLFLVVFVVRLFFFISTHFF